MKFYSEYDRMQHPQVSLIPQEIWESQLNREISGRQIELMSLPIQELSVLTASPCDLISSHH